MTNRMEVKTPRAKRDGGTYWLKIGTAFPARNGDGWNILLDALPIPDKEGRCSLSLFPAENRQQSQNVQGQGQQGGGGAPMDDEIPFAPEVRV